MFSELINKNNNNAYTVLDTILRTKLITWDTSQFPTGGSQVITLRIKSKTLVISVIKEISHLSNGLLG